MTEYIHAHTISEGTYPSLAVLTKQISDSVEQYGSVAKTPLDKVQNLRNDMYLASEGFRVLAKDKENELSAAEKGQIADFKKELDRVDQVHPDCGSRSAWRSRSASARWSAGSASSSPSARRSARPT